MFWDGPQPAKRVRLAFEDGAIKSLCRMRAGAEVPLVRLEPLQIGGIYPAGNEDRVLVRLSDVPPHLVKALIATEDRTFYSHKGFAPRSLVRAALSLGSDRVQGGSTITQQLVKNFFLTPERTLQRKVTELFMAVLLELHYDKEEILETYLNEIYLGQDRDRAIHGVGLAAQYYFGKEVQHLSVAESALLVGMVKGPAFYDPYRHPAARSSGAIWCCAKRATRTAITLEQYAEARGSALGVGRKAGVGTSPYPAFLALVHRQLRRDYDEADLRSEGLRIFTTLDPRVQSAAERALTQAPRAVRQGEALRPAGPRRRGGGHRSAKRRSAGARRRARRALSRLQPRGRRGAPGRIAPEARHLSDCARRALALYAAHAARRRPVRLEKPRRARLGAAELRQEVPRHRAAAHRARPLLQRRCGAPGHRARRRARARQRAQARRRARLKPFASALLGAVEMSPLEVAQMYQTIASGGFRSPLRAIREVTTRKAGRSSAIALAVEQAFAPEPMYLLTAALQGVVRDGTGQGLKSFLPRGASASPEKPEPRTSSATPGSRASPAIASPWSGSATTTTAPRAFRAPRAALPVWGDMMAALAPEPLVLEKPERVEHVWIDPQSGLRGGMSCPGAQEVPFVQGSAPARARSVRESGRCRGRGGGSDGRKGEELARADLRKMNRAVKYLVVLLVLLGGCATPPPEPAPPGTSVPAPAPDAAPPPPVARSENIAVAGLMETARADAAVGKLANAAASIERALRIEPRNPRLWQELARVRLKQGQFLQAEQVAARSNSWAGKDNALRAENWRLIAEARDANGDADGARTARESADKLR